MPKLSPTATESKIEEWHVKEGDFIETGDSYYKASMSHDAQEDGYIARLFESDGMIPINNIIGVQVAEEKDIAIFKDFSPTDPGEKSEQTETKEETQPEKVEEAEISDAKHKKAEEKSSQNDSKRTLITPLAKTLAEEEGIDLSKVTATGRLGEITKKDLSISGSGSKQKDSVPMSSAKGKNVTSGEFVDIPLTPMRSVIAKRLLESKNTIPHFSLTVECEVDELLRKKLNAIEGVKISVNDLIIKACAQALKRVKTVNSAWMDTFIRYNNVDISVAVTTDTGLLTPIVRDADKKGLEEISAEMKDLAAKAREGKLQPSQFQGGTFTISNLGMMGISEFSAIINPPQSAILAIGCPIEKLYMNKEGNVANKKMMKVTISCDHRTVDGSKAAEWLNSFRSFIQNPTTMAL